MISREKFDKLCKENNIFLNYYFAIRQEANEEMIKRIIYCHHRRQHFEKKIFEAVASKDVKKINSALKKIVEWDFKVQEAWGFNRDASKLQWIHKMYERFPLLQTQINKVHFLSQLTK